MRGKGGFHTSTMPHCAPRLHFPHRCESSSVNEAMQKKAGGHFQLACACAFEGVHKAPMDVGINHPAQVWGPGVWTRAGAGKMDALDVNRGAAG